MVSVPLSMDYLPYLYILNGVHSDRSTSKRSEARKEE